MKTRALVVAVTIALLCALCSGASAAAIADPALWGSVDDGIYENAVLGISCPLKGWYFYSQQELRLYMSEITVMYAAAPTGLATVNIQARDMSPYSSAPSVDEILDHSIDETKKLLERQGFQNVQVEKSEVYVGLDLYPCLKSAFQVQGIQNCQKQVTLMRGHYLVFITVTGTSFDETDEIYAGFTLS